ncbi:MAG: hypothetical protein JSS67_06080 [Bacteroidetes bacterium]|nr:hypothetical protein [Bacteroidota bacterium]
MNEELLLQVLGQISTEFDNGENEQSQLNSLKERMASAIFSNQQGHSMSHPFLFEKIQKPVSGKIRDEQSQSLQALFTQPGTEKESSAIRVFRREVPFHTSQIKSSAPEWARGALVSATIGPITGTHGRPIWYDIYKVEKGVKIYLQGASQPAIILPLNVPLLSPINTQYGKFTIPEGSAWINAALFTHDAPDDEFIGLKLKSGSIVFSQNISLQNEVIQVSPGIMVTVDLILSPQIASGEAPGNIGIDAKNATINLPEKISFYFSHTGAHITSAGDASWKLYEQDNQFTYEPEVPAFYLSQMNRVLIPFQVNATSFNIKSASIVIPLRGKAAISQAAWSFSCARIDIQNTLEANGAGALMMNLKTGIEVTWKGLSDIHLQNEVWIQLRSPWLLAEPGRISITDTDAFGNFAKQEYPLWKNKKNNWNKIQLEFTDHFLFFYNSIQTGNESIMTFTDCYADIDKPVDVAAMPFDLKSKTTFFILSFSDSKNLIMLYDNNLLTDNNAQPNTPVYFIPKAIGLNNALLTVSPIAGFLLYGELDVPGILSKTVLLLSFGLLHYLPTLPDPYVSNVTAYRERSIREKGNQDKLIAQDSINQLLVALLQWQKEDLPVVVFLWGDVDGGEQQNTSPYNPTPTLHETTQPTNSYKSLVTDKPIAFNLKQNKSIAERNANALNKHLDTLKSGMYDRAGYSQEAYTRSTVSMVNNAPPRLPNTSLFSLLDVSTQADLLGINIGFTDERLIFGEKYVIEDNDEQENPFAIQGMDVVATSRFVRIFTVPQISWEPLFNIPAADINNPPTPWDPPLGVLKFDDDGLPAIIGNTGTKPVTMAPIPAVKELTDQYPSDSHFKAWSIFTLPNGMTSIGRYDQENHYYPTPNTKGAQIELLKAAFGNGTQAGWQIITRAGKNPNEGNTVFEGQTFQNSNVHHIYVNGSWSILGKTPTEIFNNEFGVNGLIQRGIPLERYDFTGYGAQVFSSWLNKKAEIAQVSQAIFDVWRGRVAKEIIQVRSIIYPWGIRVVRTITMHRGSTGFEYRVDSGWRADSDGVYDFKTLAEPSIDYDFHPGLVKGVFNVKNIVENDLAPLEENWFKNYGVYIDNNTGLAVSVGAGVNLKVEMVPVYFDADVYITDIDGTTKDAHGVPVGRLVPSKKMIGYLQVAPKGVILSPEFFSKVLNIQNGLGGPVDCMVNIHGSGQKMRVSRVEVNHSLNTSGKIVFATAVEGMPVLPKDGSWSLAKHIKSSKEVVPVTETAISLIRQGLLINGIVTDQSHPKEITAIPELFKNAEDRETQYAFLQNTDTQKILFRNPFFKMGEALLHSTMPDLGDAYKLLNSKGLFPNLDGLEKIDFDAAGCATKIIEEGFQMVDKAATNIAKMLQQKFQNFSFTFIDKPGILKVYIEYAATDADGNKTSDGILNVDINSQVNNWVNKMNDVTMVVDLVGMERLFMISGKFDTAKGESPEFKGPKLIPGHGLKPIIDILEILEMIGTSNDYADIVKKGLQIAMSNSPNNWEYKFQADKEIPVLQFPPAYLDGPTTPLRLKANMKLGVYFNMGMELPPAGLPALSAGAFIEFGAELHVMCVSLAAATIYAVGQVNLKISADTIKGPGLYLKLGFGVELMVGIPVVGNVSVYYGVGIEMSLDTTQITVAAFITFKGRAEIFGGIVTIQILIEASGKIHKEIGSGRTDCIAQVSFRIDISIVFVINIHETETWQETRQIA